MAEQANETDQAATAEAVLALLRDDLGKTGFQDALDADHVATFIQRGPKLLVIFETLHTAAPLEGEVQPLGVDFAEDKNWSILHIAARRDTWFRSDAVVDLFDGLVDDCFFEEFDQVSFYGAGTAAYGACAYSVAAPGSSVLAISPQATLDVERAGWDSRFPAAKRIEFSDRYGFAPDMVEGARKVYILFDPFRPLDHVHATLFQGPNVTRLKCRHFDGQIEQALRDMECLHQVVEGASTGALTPSDFFALLRRRRRHNRYLRTLLHALGRRNKTLRIAFLCRYVLEQGMGGPVFRRTLKQAKALIGRDGPLPEWLLDGPDDENVPEPRQAGRGV